MSENINKLLETKEKLDIVLEKTDKMKSFSLNILNLSRKIKKSG
jgi:hypothetical protein